MEKKVLIANLPEFLDEWTLRKLIPCAERFISIEINPDDSTKLIAEAESRESALNIVEELDGCELLGCILQARCVVSGATAPKRDAEPNNGLSFANLSSGFSENDSTESVEGAVASASAGTVISPISIATSSSSVSTVISSPPVWVSQNPEGTGTSKVFTLSEVPSVAEPTPAKCRFCLRAGHDTYHCVEYGEYYSVSISEKGVTPDEAGCVWPDAAVHKVIGLNAGPVIRYFENTFFKEELCRDEYLILFAYLTNSVVCENCGATGHRPDTRIHTRQLCQYLPTADRPTDHIMETRRRFCRRIRGVRRKHSLGKLQNTAAAESSKFWKGIRGTLGTTAQPAKKRKATGPSCSTAAKRSKQKNLSKKRNIVKLDMPRGSVELEDTLSSVTSSVFDVSAQGSATTSSAGSEISNAVTELLNLLRNSDLVRKPDAVVKLEPETKED